MPFLAQLSQLLFLREWAAAVPIAVPGCNKKNAWHRIALAQTACSGLQARDTAAAAEYDDCTAEQQQH